MRTTPRPCGCWVALRENGYEVATAATGHLALGEVAKRDPDVILLDLFLSGGMNGGEFLDEFVGKLFDLELLLQSVRRFAYG